MKKANHNTGHILIRAFTNSEWDKCSFAIIRITGEWIESTRKRIDSAIQFREDSSFYHLSFWESPEGFYNDPAIDEQIVDESFFDCFDWCFVELTGGELGRLSIPENPLELFQLIVRGDGSLCYKARGEYSGEEFCTFDFRLSDIIQKIKSYDTE